MLARMWRKGKPYALWVGRQTGAATVESSAELPQKLQNRTALWPSDSTSGNLSEETWHTNSEVYVHPYVHCMLFIIIKIWKQPKCPSVDEWIKQLWYIYIVEYYMAIKKKKIFFLCDNIDGPENIMLSEISQSEKDKHHMISLTCGI